MKKSIAIIALAAFCAMTALSVQAAEPNLQAGSKSLFFGFSGMNDLSIDDTRIGAQYLWGNGCGAWVDLGFGISNFKEDENAPEAKGTKIGMDIGYIYYFMQKGPVACYVSPQFGFSTLSAEIEVNSVTNKDSQTEISFGASLGAEWWFAESMSLSCSAYLGYVGTTITKELGSSKTESTRTDIGILGSGGKFVLSFYF